MSDERGWKGDVVSNSDGNIMGCNIELVEDSSTEWIIRIDGAEADLAKFSDAIYKKLISDAKNESFQGFRKGSIPPHLLPTYKAFTMDEVCREAAMEAMQQNDIRPFETAREDMEFSEFSIPPIAPKKKKKKKRKKKTVAAEGEEKNPDDEQAIIVEVVPSWRFYATMKETIDAGWQPGQTFSFVARSVKGQKMFAEKTRFFDPLRDWLEIL